MACMEHECSSCGTVWFDNGPGVCPKCGSQDIVSHFDEMDDHYNLPDLWNEDENQEEEECLDQ